MRKRRNRGRETTRQNKTTMIAITFVVCTLFGVLLYGGNELQQRINENQEKIAELELKQAEQERRSDEIEQLEEEMQTDEYIAKKAQEVFNLVKENEIILKPEK